eukprot:CAMPEP_0114110776 /NCGR_PEP_ID=MMETSP0043_2-20121206/1488_1 /TAXON_ID=464988 /ORGANISM="Hemiselmis andersenii, Strain CCMP644" /LENGTH=241 /DNA_ID=CAMNT_0001202739 /DNA_START=27 /DNA_END=749 /DNA_ORIENTATION=+
MTANTQLMEAKQGDGAGVELRENVERNDPDLGPGVYTKKTFHIDKRFPPWLRMIAPKSGSSLEEEAQNSYPVTRTSMTLPLFSKFKINVRTVHCQDRGEQENVHNLDAQTLKKREVVRIDISAKDKGKEKMYEEDTADPSTFVSKKTGRGPLRKGWEREVEPVMCAYKLVYAEFDYPLLQGKVEEFMHAYQTNLFTTANRNLWCWVDEWHGMSLHDVRDYEREVAERTNLITSIKSGLAPY